jgi:hypothetical protein
MFTFDPGLDALGLVQKQSQNPKRFEDPRYFKRLFAAGTRASSLGLAVMDSQTRFEAVNASLAHETRAGTDHHIGRTSREIVGDLAKQIEPTYEQVIRTGRPASVMLTGHVRDTPEFGYWLDHCFPITDTSGRVQKLGLFVVNITAEKSAIEIFDALATDSKRQLAETAGLLSRFEEAIKGYHFSLMEAFHELSCPVTESGRKAHRFRTSIQRLDQEISDMRELVYAVIRQFSIPRC